MADNSDPLDKILQKLEALESEMHRLSSRLDAIDKKEMHDASAGQVSGETLEQSASAPAPPPLVSPDPTPPQPKSPPPVIPKKAPRALAPGPLTKTVDDQPKKRGIDILYQSENRLPPKGSSTGVDKPKDSWEMRIASRWFSRIGIFFLALVLILLAREHVQGPLGKVVGAYLLSAIMIVAGLFYERKFPQWARPVLAGGLAFSYFASYAMGFVEPMRLLDSLPAKLTVLAVNIAVIFGFAQWKKSETMAGTALALGYLTTGVVGNDLAALCSSLGLSVVAVLFLWRNQWFTATAMASTATYIAYLYIWKAVPEVADRSASEAFWFHFLFLSLNFAVYTVAGFVGKPAALAEHARFEGTVRAPTRRSMLTILTQTNVGAYIAGMIVVLKSTQVYWENAWMFFLPMAAVCAALSLLFGGLRAVQVVYVLAATVCFTIGLISVASPAWLPVFLTLQAVVMLLATRQRASQLWCGLSFAVLLYGCGYLVTGGWIDWLHLAASQPVIVTYPWWPYCCVAALSLIYACAWERYINGWGPDSSLPGKVKHSHKAVEGESDPGNPASLGSFLAAALAAFIWRFTLQFYETPDGYLVLGMAVPVVAIATVLLKFKSPVVFVVLTMIFGIVSWDLWRDALSVGTGSYRPLLLLGIGGLCAGWLVERNRYDDEPWSRFLWRALYLWSQVMISIGILRSIVDWYMFAAWAAVVVICVAAGWMLRSAALAKSSYVAVAALLLWSFTRNINAVPTWAIIGCSLLILTAVYPMALPLWQRRTGDRMTNASYLAQAGVILALGLIWSRGLTDHGVNSILTIGSWTLVCAVVAASGLCAMVAHVAVVFAVYAALALLSQWGDSAATVTTEAHGATDALWSLTGVFMIVAAERVLRLAPKIALPWANDRTWWLSRGAMGQITAVLAIGTLAMAVVVLRMMPDLRVFYFTGALVAAAFIWIVLGIWFHEPVYRKSGFVLLCVGIAKGLIWDVMSLKNTIYRQISWTVLGLLALAASFLYNKFRGRLE